MRIKKRIDDYHKTLAEEEEWEKTKRERELREKLLIQEEKIANELERRKNEKVRREKMIQRVREESEELRELEAKLKNAYVNLEREHQLRDDKAKRPFRTGRRQVVRNTRPAISQKEHGIKESGAGVAARRRSRRR